MNKNNTVWVVTVVIDQFNLLDIPWQGVKVFNTQEKAHDHMMETISQCMSECEGLYSIEPYETALILTDMNDRTKAIFTIVERPID